MSVKILGRGAIIIACLVTGLFIGVLAVYFTAPFPDVGELKTYHPLNATKVYDRENHLIGEYAIERRNSIPSEKIPPLIKAAFIAAEDARFFSHKGIDFSGILRALMTDVTKMRFSQGGSTITQQLVKLLYLSPEKSVKRKVLEMLLAIKVERKLSKEEILYLYLNQIYLGNGSYGIDAASFAYFGKEPGKLSLGEIALLASLPKSPGFYSPYRHLGRALIRRKYVLGRMAEDKYITKYDARIAAALPLKLAERGKKKRSSYFIEYVRTYLLKKYGYDMLYKGGLRVHTTLSPKLQKLADTSVREWVEKLEEKIQKRYASGLANRKTVNPVIEGMGASRTLQGALLSMDLETGEILAMVGGRDYSESQFNRALQSRRQPGSAFKPVIYTSAVENGYTPADLIDDIPVEYVRSDEENWRPSNYDNRFLGEITLREALAHSRNLATVRLLDRIGIGTTIKTARKLGISEAIPEDLSIALGSVSLSLLELCRAYATIGNRGMRPKPIFIREVNDKRGNVLERNDPELEKEISPESAYIMTYMLQEVIRSGTGRRARFLGNNLAGKTGTTNNFVDAWFVGYSPKVLTGVWVGFDTPVSMGKGNTGAIAALPIWTRYMKKAIQKYPSRGFRIPPGIVFAKIDPKNGKPVKKNSHGIMVPFKLGTVPRWQSHRAETRQKKAEKFQDDIL